MDSKCLTSTPPDYGATVERLSEVNPNLADAIAEFRSVEHILQWMDQHIAGKPDLDIVAQDEFEYDFIIRFEKSKWIVFGVT